MCAAPLQTSTVELFAIIVGKINLKPLDFLAERSMSDISLDPNRSLDTKKSLKFRQGHLPDNK